MVFRRDNKAGDAFQRQMSALRQQLGGETPAEGGDEPGGEPAPGQAATSYDPYAAPGAVDPAGGLGAAVTRAAGYEEYGGYVEGADAAGVTGFVVPTAPVLPDLPAVDARTTVIAQDTTWKGEISSEGTVHVHGRFEGSIRAKSGVFVADRADIDATVNAETVVVAGLIKGTIRCGVRFEVLPTGRVTGDVQSPTLVVHEGALVTGQFRMGPGESAGADSKPTSVIQRRAARGSA